MDEIKNPAKTRAKDVAACSKSSPEARSCQAREKTACGLGSRIGGKRPSSLTIHQSASNAAGANHGSAQANAPSRLPLADGSSGSAFGAGAARFEDFGELGDMAGKSREEKRTVFVPNALYFKHSAARKPFGVSLRPQPQASR